MQHRGFVVAHTHWDRAWYLPFQTFRIRLVRMIDEIIELLERDISFRSFTLDGQTVLLEDYLELRPEKRQRIASLVKRGRLTIGPWYTMPDLFLPCGEAIIRNLQFGRKIARQFGEPLQVGYVPDSFGHFAQFPQILRGFGIDSFIFMRGAGQFIEQTGSIFDWQGPDGSSVLAIYLREGYLAAGALGHPLAFGRYDQREVSLEDAAARIKEIVGKLAPMQSERSLLMPAGGDHMPLQPELPVLLKQLNETLPDVELRQADISEFVGAVKAENLQHSPYQGDLLGNLHHPLLSSVYSTRIYLKQMNRKAERALIRLAEPLLACLGRELPDCENTSFLDKAWRLLFYNHAHDDICGCSADQVHDEDEVRYNEVCNIAETLITEKLEQIVLKGIEPLETEASPGMLSSDVFVFNPHPFPVRKKFETSILMPCPGGEFAEPTPERALEGIGAGGKQIPVKVFRSHAMKVRSQYLETTWGRQYDLGFELELPGLGYEIVNIREIKADPIKYPPAMQQVIRSPKYRLELVDKRLSLIEIAGDRIFPDMLRIEFTSDYGDTYSYGPATDEAPIYADLIGATRESNGSESFRLKYLLKIPVRPESPFPEAAEIVIDARVKLNVEDGLQFFVEYSNSVKNGRLRALLPVGFVTDSFYVDSQFMMSERRLPEQFEPLRPYPGEKAYETFHQGEFAFAENGDWRTWLANRGNPEISIVQSDKQTWFALTLHRAVGMLSVKDGKIRQCGAGPAISTPGAQCLRMLKHEFAWGSGELPRSDLVNAALTFSCPGHIQELPHLPYAKKAGSFPRAAGMLEIDNPFVRLVAFRPGENLVLRLFNWSEKPQSMSVRLGFSANSWSFGDLDEAPVKNTGSRIMDGSFSLDIDPFTIRTVIIR